MSSIQPIDRTLSGATIPGQSIPWSNGNEGVLHIHQSSCITRTSPSDCLVSYPGHSRGGGVLLLCRGAIGVFYGPGRQGSYALWNLSLLHLVYLYISWGHRWKSKDEFISDIVQWSLTHGCASVGRPARTYLYQLCADTGHRLKDLPGAINDRDRWREREGIKEIRANSATWWWW